MLVNYAPLYVGKFEAYARKNVGYLQYRYRCQVLLEFFGAPTFMFYIGFVNMELGFNFK
jgi:hypothetical protein